MELSPSPVLVYNKFSPSSYGFMIFMLFLFTSMSAFAQKGGGNKNNKDLIVRACTEEIGNGLYQVSFSYENPTNQEITVNDDDSYVISSKGNKKSKGVKNFKKGRVDGAFFKQFAKGESVEWTVVNPNGNIHTVVASANSSHCPPEEEGFIFPVYGGDGKYDDLIGSKLGSLADGTAGDNPSDLIFQIDNSQRVLIEVVPNPNQTQGVIDRLQSFYGLTTSDFLIAPAVILSNNLTTVDVAFPINRLNELNTEVVLINFVRPLYPSLQNNGITTTQGDGAQKTDAVRDAYRMVVDGEIVPVDGRGVKIGVISDSFDKQPFTQKSNATIDVENGDLPGIDNPNDYLTPVDVVKEFEGPVASDEGRAMMHIIHDIVPSAELAFYSGIESPREFELGVQGLDLAGCDVIVDDITFITEPFFGLGRVSDAIAAFTSSAGNAYFSSAGNFGDDGYQTVFQASTSTPPTNFLSAGSDTRAHVFGTNTDGSPDVLQRFSVEGGKVYMIVLQWDEPLASQENTLGANSDLDIYIVDDLGRLLVGNNRINEAGDPTEIIVFQATESGEANIMITSANGPPSPGLSMRYVAYRANGLEVLEYGGAPTISGHAMTPEANAVASVDFRNADNPVAQPFSSYAGVLANGFNATINFAAPDGGNTNVASIGNDISGEIGDSDPDNPDNFPNFFGTSAAAPHAASAYAILLSASRSWFPDGFPTQASTASATASIGTNDLADQILDLYGQNTTPAGDATRVGPGLIDAEKVFEQIAAKTAKITELVVEDGKTPSAEPFQVTILGQYFPEEPTVTFDGQPLVIVSSTENQIVAEVPRFTENPGLTVDTNPLTPGETDGGPSDPAFFFDGNKRAINIIADNISREYGQTVSFSYTVEGLGEGETPESVGLPAIVYTTPAVFPYPDVNNYVIFPDFETVLTPEQQENFQVNFINGKLEVTKKDLLIQLQDQEYVYGEAILGDLQYVYDVTEVENNEAFLQLIESSHAQDFYIENSLILVNRLRAVVNQEQILNLLENGGWMTSENTIVNRLRAVVNEMKVIDLDPVQFENYLNITEDPITNRLRAVVNRLRAVVNGQDLLDGIIDLSIENRLRAVVNESGLGGDNDENEYSSIFAVIDVEDAESEPEAGDGGVSSLYAMNLITGLEVTNGLEDRHYIYPGAFLSSLAANFNITFGFGRYGISPAELTVTTGDYLIHQNEEIDVTQIPLQIEGYVYEETIDSIFPEGVEFRFEDDYGREYESGDSGIFNIYIQDPENYVLQYASVGKLYVSPNDGNLRKVRSYLDCIEVDLDAPDGLYYTANYRYVNPNDVAIYVLQGPDNNLSGPAVREGEPPVIFLAGEGTFKVRFDGQRMVWNLTTFDTTQKSSTSSEATAESGKCDAKDVGSIEEAGYMIFPVPFEDQLTIQRTVYETGTVEVHNTSGLLVASESFRKNKGNDIILDMSSVQAGIYFIRISTSTGTISKTISKN